MGPLIFLCWSFWRPTTVGWKLGDLDCSQCGMNEMFFPEAPIFSSFPAQTIVIIQMVSIHSVKLWLAWDNLYQIWTTNWVPCCLTLPFNSTELFIKVPSNGARSPNDHQLWLPSHKTNEPHHGFPTKINQKYQGIRKRIACEAASNYLL